MDIQRATDFLRSHHRAILATRRSDGSPQLSPIVAAVDDDGAILISTRTGRQGPEPGPRPARLPLRDQRRVLRSVDPGRRDRRNCPSSRRSRAAGGLLPEDLWRAPRLGRVPVGHGPRPAADPADHHRPGRARYQRLSRRAGQANDSPPIWYVRIRRPAPGSLVLNDLRRHLAVAF